MESTSTSSCSFRFRLRTLVILIGLVSLVLAFVAREAHLRDELRLERARADANLQKARAALDLYYTQVAERSAATSPQNDQFRRGLLERTLEFYQGMESKASSPEERTRILERMNRIRMELEQEERTDNGKS
jgi:hypothetical protein